MPAYIITITQINSNQPALLFSRIRNCSDCPRVVRVQGESAQFISINEHFQSYRVLLSLLTCVHAGDAEIGQHEGNLSSYETIEVATHTSITSAPDATATVAPFRAWRSSQLLVARAPMPVAIMHSKIEP